MNFDEDYWLEAIKKPDWYLELVPYVKKIQKGLGGSGEAYDKFNYTTRHFFEKALKKGQVALGKDGPNFDEQREPIDTIVIHHTSSEPGYRLSYMDAVHLLNIYATYYAEPRDEREKGLKGRPIWSGHFSGGRQIFYAYHWFMRTDGTFERLLDDNKIGWQAGNWAVNKRSIAICLDNDYEKKDPTDEILQKLADFINQNYPKMKVMGHCEARETNCPGINFLQGWKPKLLNYLK